jgi:cobalt-zinc-cadmium efflux system membrane fusion protein
MASAQLRTFLHHLRRVVGPRGGGASDAQLLERFVSRRDDAAFEVLVWRHGGLVLDVCGRLLRQAEDAEDVFQATFLALARRAGSIGKRESLGSWLYKVAYRLALRVRARAAREAALRQSLPDLLAPGPAGSDAGPDLRPLLDEEINRLPEKYRAAVVLYYLQGKTTEEAARQLGCARGTVCSRLSWARQRLRNRLTRRGLVIGAAGLGLTLAPAVAPAALVGATVNAALLFASGPAAGALTGQAVTLAEGVVRAMVLTKVKVAAVVLLSLGALGLAAGLSTQRVLAEKPEADEAPALVRGRGDGVRMPAEALAKLGIQVAEVKPPPSAKARVLQLTGTLAIDPDRLARVRCRFAPAEVVEIGRPKGKGEDRPLRPGDKVRKGQLLAAVDSIEVGAKKNDLYLAQTQLNLGKERLAYTERMYKKGYLTETHVLNARRAVQADQNAVTLFENSLSAWGIPAREIEAVRKEGGAEGDKPETQEAVKARMKRWTRVELTAPEDGTIIERNVSRNEVVTDRTVNLFQIARLDQLVVLAQVSEADLRALDALKPEQRRWDIRPSADRDAPAFQGWIDDVGHVIDPNVNTALAKGFVENREGRLRAGQAVTATVTLPPPAGEVTLPATAVVEEGHQAFVFVQPDAKKFVYEQRRVSVVRRGGDVVSVRSRLTPEQERQGLQTVRPGERVVTAGSVELKAILDDLKAGDDR